MNCIEKINHYLKGYCEGKDVLEVGSMDGESRLRTLLTNQCVNSYTGIDIQMGINVDYDCYAEDILEVFNPDEFDIIVSSNVLEHVYGWQDAIHGMKTVCKTGGLIAMTVPSAYPYHKDPEDHWRYSITDMRLIFSDFDILEIHEVKQDASAYVPGVPANEIDAREVFILACKPTNFKEINLEGYKLHNIKEGEWTKLK